MQRALSDLNKVAKVFGSYVNTEDGELVAFEAPETFSEDILREAGRISIQGFQGIESTGYKVKKMELEFNEYRLINQRVKGGIISVICDKIISLPLLNLTLNVVSRKIEAILQGDEIEPIPERPKSKPETIKPPVEEKIEAEEKPKEEPKKVVEKPSSNKKHVQKIFFDLLEEDFAKRIGPMAKFIIDDYIDEIGEHRDTFPTQKVNDLINKLSSEIDKRSDRNKFKQKMKAAFDKSS